MQTTNPHSTISTEVLSLGAAYNRGLNFLIIELPLAILLIGIIIISLIEILIG